MTIKEIIKELQNIERENGYAYMTDETLKELEELTFQISNQCCIEHSDRVNAALDVLGISNEQ